MFISDALAQASEGGSVGDLFGSIAPLILIFVVFYFLLIRPQQKKQKDHRARLEALRRGDRILTGGGIYGVITKVIGEGELQVEIAEGVRVQVATHTVLDVPHPPDTATPADTKGKQPQFFANLLRKRRQAPSTNP